MDKAEEILFRVKKVASRAGLDRFKDKLSDISAIVLWSKCTDFQVFKTYVNLELPGMEEREMILFSALIRFEKDTRREGVFIPKLDELIEKAKQKVDQLRPYLGCIVSKDEHNHDVYEAATRVSKKHFVTFWHKSHSGWAIGQTVPILVDDVSVDFKVADISEKMDLILLETTSELSVFADLSRGMLKREQVYIQLGLSNQSADPFSVSVGALSSNSIDQRHHIRGSIPPRPGDFGGPVFDNLSGRLIGIAVGSTTSESHIVGLITILARFSVNF